jgi:mannose-6-phosphate isomerase-like protein (cupin superfamily)
MKRLLLFIVKIIISIMEYLYSENPNEVEVKYLRKKYEDYNRKLSSYRSILMSYLDGEVENVNIEYIEDTDWFKLRTDSDDVYCRLLAFNSKLNPFDLSLTEMLKGSEISKHKHDDKLEAIYVIQGKVIDAHTGVETSSGEIYEIPKKAPHHIIALDHSYLIVTFHD